MPGLLRRSGDRHRAGRSRSKTLRARRRRIPLATRGPRVDARRVRRVAHACRKARKCSIGASAHVDRAERGESTTRAPCGRGLAHPRLARSQSARRRCRGRLIAGRKFRLHAESACRISQPADPACESTDESACLVPVVARSLHAHARERITSISVAPAASRCSSLSPSVHASVSPAQRPRRAAPTSSTRRLIGLDHTASLRRYLRSRWRLVPLPSKKVRGVYWRFGERDARNSLPTGAQRLAIGLSSFQR